MGTYNPFIRGNPDGSAQDGPTFSSKANINDAALLDAVMVGQAPGFAMTPAGGSASEPATLTWGSGAYRVRASITWGTSGGENGMPKAIAWESSINSGTTWDTPAIASQTATFDANGNITATTNAGGFVSWLMALIGKLKQHIAATGTAAHGAGNMATQNKTAVDITGGTVAGVAITGATASLTYEREARTQKGTLSASTPLDWAAAGCYTATINGTGAAFTFQNLPNGVAGFLTLDLTNPGVATTLFSGVKWQSGSYPSFTAAGRDVVTLFCHDGTVVTGMHVKDVK